MAADEVDTGMTRIEPARFGEWAGKSPERWRTLAGGKVDHPHRGSGEILRVEDWEGFGLNVFVRYSWPGDKETAYETRAFGNEPWTEVQAPTEGLSEFIEWQRTRDAIEERRRKYLGAAFPRIPDLEWLDRVLLAIDVDGDLTEEDQKLLEREGLFGPLGDYLARRYERRRDGWDLVHACKYWRRDGKPEKAVREDGKHDFGDSRLTAALLTTIAAAYKDLGQLGEAQARCLRAVGLHESHHPYNVLGGVFYRMGQFEEGDRWFERARTLDGPTREQEQEIRQAFAVLAPARRQELIAHLERGDADGFRSLSQQLSGP